MQPSYRMAIEVSRVDAASMDAWTVAIEEAGPQHQAADSRNQSETIGPSRVMNADQVALRDLVNAKVECRTAGHLHDSTSTAVEESFIDAIRRATGSAALKKKSNLIGLIGGSISRMMEIGQLDSYLETQLSNLADSNMFLNSNILKIKHERKL